MRREPMDELPPVRRRAKYDWDTRAQWARDASPSWIEAYASVPVHTISVVNRREVEPFQARDGRFEAAVRKRSRNRYRLYIRFIAYTDEELMQMEESNDE